MLRSLASLRKKKTTKKNSLFYDYFLKELHPAAVSGVQDTPDEWYVKKGEIEGTEPNNPLRDSPTKYGKIKRTNLFPWLQFSYKLEVK